MTQQDGKTEESAVLDETWTRVTENPGEDETTGIPRPEAEAVQSLFAGLLGRRVVVRSSEPLRLKSVDPRTVAEYVTDDGCVQALCVCDIDLACHSGAALSMIPTGVALQGIRRHELEENLSDNFREIMNVLASLLNATGSPHLVFRSLFLPKQEVSDEVKSLLLEPPTRVDLEIEIDGYGGGKATLVIAEIS
jgi:hypothetical protein